MQTAQKRLTIFKNLCQSTMEAADSLWGVTMEEEGVSKLLSVRLQGQGIA
jgi:chromosome segregation ATPase